MPQRGRVVIDFSHDDSPSPPPMSQSMRHIHQPVSDSRFITPSDDSDDEVQILDWGFRKQPNDKASSNTQKSNVGHPSTTRPSVQESRNNDTKKIASQTPSGSRLPQQPPARVGTTRSSQPPLVQQPPAQLRRTQPPALDSIAQHPAPLVPTQASNNNPVSITNPSTREFLAALSKSRTFTPSSSILTPTLPPGARPLPPGRVVPSSQSQPQSQRPLPALHSGAPRLHAPRPHVPVPVNARDSMGSAASQSQPTPPTRQSQPSAPASRSLAPSVITPSPFAPNLPSKAVTRDTSRESDPNRGHSQAVLQRLNKSPTTPALKSKPSSSVAANSSSNTLPELQTVSQPRKEPVMLRASPKMPPASINKVPSQSHEHSLPQQKRVLETIEIESSSEDDFVTAAARAASPRPRSSGNNSSTQSSPRTSKRKLVGSPHDEEPVKRVRSTRLSAVSKPPIENPSQDDAVGSVEDDLVGSVEDDQQPFTFPADISKIPPFSNRYGQPFTLEEDALIIHLKEVVGIPWKEFERFFPGRKWPSMQTRYSKVLSKRTARPVATTSLTQPLPRSTRGLRRTTQAQADSVDPSVASQEEAEAETVDEDPNRCRRSVRPLSYLVRHRELGSRHGREWPRKFQAGVRDLVYSSIGAQAYMDNASGDVSTIAWSPDGNHFAAGAVAVTDVHSVDYNKPRNLVVGSVATQNIKELPHHTINHLLPSGQRKELFSTVQVVAFSPDSKYMYSAGIDQRLHRYRVDGSPQETTLVHSVEHPASVDFLSVSDSGLVATGCASSGPSAIKILSYDDDTLTGSICLSGTVQSKKTPSALRWGAAHQHQNYLLAGFSREAEVFYAEDDRRDKEGEVALWDINTQQRIETDAPNRNVFDLAWNPSPGSNSSIFAVASRPISHVGHGIHSVVRLYSPQQTRAQHTMELDCPAWDINDVVYSPHDNNLIAVGSTEGRVYIWDVRYAKHGQLPLNTLKHGESLAIMPHERKRWEVDTGIRFLSWGTERDRLYTGSSDGVVACWDPYRGDSDKHVRDVVHLNSAVMSGAFSPDYSHLLIGEDATRLNLLSVGNNGAKFDRRTTKFSVEEAPLQYEPGPTLWDCQKMLNGLALEVKPAGTMPFRQVVQGPNYKGPYCPDAEAAREKAQRFQDKALRSFRRRKKQTRKSGLQTTDPCGLDCGFIPLPDDYEAPETWLSKRIPDRIWEWVNERADVDCFRCGKTATISPRAQIIECENCGTAWRSGALGYEVIEQVKASGSRSKAGDEGVIDLCDSEDERERFVLEVSTETSDSDSEIEGR
ncbi:unnamed protein product [Aureobasidium vineae]|uniref:WD40 repeat-like protein n=1 Tax=Aureobasidium vineae TaxID=2773715 RepID=A0A9N8JTU5_9PEZI|nr:unnamed protein product [Aureobasidium vineae]